jgi:hypothetical protein
MKTDNAAEATEPKQKWQKKYKVSDIFVPHKERVYESLGFGKQRANELEELKNDKDLMEAIDIWNNSGGVDGKRLCRIMCSPYDLMRSLYGDEEVIVREMIYCLYVAQQIFDQVLVKGGMKLNHAIRAYREANIDGK